MINYTGKKDKNQEIVIEEKYTTKKNQNLNLITTTFTYSNST